MVQFVWKIKSPFIPRVKEVHMTAKVASPSLEKAFAHMSLDPSAEAKAPAAVPVSRTAPAVQKVYDQKDFERENAEFEKVYSAQRVYLPFKEYFSESVYDIADGKKEPCLLQHKTPNPDYPDNQNLSIIMTLETIRVLNQCFRDPIRRLGKNPTDQQIQAIYDGIMTLPSFLERDKIQPLCRADQRRRVHNLIDTFYRLEGLVIGKWLVRTNRVASLPKVAAFLFNPSDFESLNPQGSFAEAIGCEEMQQNAKLNAL